MAIVLELEEPYELVIYCGRYGCDWRLRDPVTKRFVKAPLEVYFVCHKRGSLDTRKGSRKVTIEAEMQGVCALTREWVREQSSEDTIESNLKTLETRCISCDIVGKCLGDDLLAYLSAEITIDSVAHSYTLNPADCYIHIEEQYGTHYYERSYEGEIVDCFE